MCHTRLFFLFWVSSTAIILSCVWSLLPHHWLQKSNREFTYIFKVILLICTVLCEWNWTRPHLCSKMAVFKMEYHKIKVLSHQRLTHILKTTNETFKMRYYVNLYLNWHRKYERSKLKVPFVLSKFKRFNFDLLYFWCQLRYRFTQYLILKVSLVVLRM